MMSNHNFTNSESSNSIENERDLSFSVDSFHEDSSDGKVDGNLLKPVDDASGYPDTTTCFGDEHDDENFNDNDDIDNGENDEFEVLMPENQKQLQRGFNSNIYKNEHIGIEDEIEGNPDEAELKDDDGDITASNLDDHDATSTIIDDENSNDEDLSFGSHSHSDPREHILLCKNNGDSTNQAGHDDDSHSTIASKFNLNELEVESNENPPSPAGRNHNAPIVYSPKLLHGNSPTSYTCNQTSMPIVVTKRASKLMSLFDSPVKTNEHDESPFFTATNTYKGLYQSLTESPPTDWQKIHDNNFTNSNDTKLKTSFHRQTTQRINNNHSNKKHHRRETFKTGNKKGNKNDNPTDISKLFQIQQDQDISQSPTKNWRQIIYRQESDFSTASEVLNTNYHHEYIEYDRLLQNTKYAPTQQVYGTEYQSDNSLVLGKYQCNNHQEHHNEFGMNNVPSAQQHEIETTSSFENMIPSIGSLINGLIGSLIFGLFHIVFCLAQASAITRPYTNRPAMGPMVRVASMGTVISTPLFLIAMLKPFPDLYPSMDLFPTPFYVQQAFIIDKILKRDQMGYDDDVFLTTFCVVGGIGLLLTGLFLVVASKFKLANLGVFLPYPVMAGFFSTVGLLIWTLAFTVDTGMHIGEVLKGNWNDLDQTRNFMIHHVGSIIVAATMYRTSNVNSSYVPIITFMTIPLSHLILYLAGMSLDEACHYGWFWFDSDFKSTEQKFKTWFPPLPFGLIHGIYKGKVHWGAVYESLPITVAMALIYFIRCSIHAPALKKNTDNIQKWREEQQKNIDSKHGDEMIVENEMSKYGESSTANDKKISMDTAEVYTVFAKVLTITGLAGGTACLPALGVSSTVTKLGGSGSFPQYGATVVLIVFYLTDYELLGYIPKVTFSSLLVLSAFTMLENWFLMSYKKIKEKWEWAVVPLIVILSFTMGVLPSVFVGIAISTFIFVGAFYRSGVVKYIANGLTVHSTTERGPDDMKWLDIHGDLIQLVVLQNYLFFGNANSCFNYINTMFEEPSPADLENLTFPLPPQPQYIIIDFTMVTGMDASAVDVFIDIIKLSKENSCKVLVSGLRKELKEVLLCGGVKPSRDRKSVFHALKIYSDMDHALRKAEDALIMNVFKDEQKELTRRASTIQISAEDGFLNALKHIDSQHQMNVAEKLKDIAPYVEVVNLEKGDTLDDQGSGLFFIEHGIIKVERDSSSTTRLIRQKDRRSLVYATPRVEENYGSIGHLRVRTPTIGKESALLKHAREISDHAHTVRLARIGPGFVVGSVEVCTNSFNYHQGIYTAVVPCRLHLLSNESIKEVENTNPRLALQLYKMMSQLSAERQAATIDQLATLHSIMVSLAPSKPVDRMTMAAIQEAMKSIQD